MSRVYFNAKLIESETNIEANASSTADISYASIDIELIEPAYIKPGFPINFKVAKNSNLQSFLTQFSIPFPAKIAREKRWEIERGNTVLLFAII